MSYFRKLGTPTLFTFLIVGAIFSSVRFYVGYNKPIKVGVLHSLSGTMAESGKGVVELTLMAIDEINAAGGVMGRKLSPVVADGKSDAEMFAKQAERLIKTEKVEVIFGCWKSDSRKAVKDVVERHNIMLFYPVQYEGLESSQNIIYCGAPPSQQIVPGVNWALENVGKKFYLVGSDYVFPRTAHRIMRMQIEGNGGEVVGETYLPLGTADVLAVVDEIKDIKPDMILNTVNGSTNKAFFHQLRANGISSKAIPTMSFSIGEAEVSDIGTEYTVGDYAVWNYFQSINTPRNAEFLTRIHKRFPKMIEVDDPMQKGYLSVYLWAKAVEKGKSMDTDSVRAALSREPLNSPEGMIYVDKDNGHIWQAVRIAKVNSKGQFRILWETTKQIQPQPFLIDQDD